MKGYTHRDLVNIAWNSIYQGSKSLARTSQKLSSMDTKKNISNEIHQRI